MGHERKRGKLSDLNALLRGGAGDRFSRVVGDVRVLTGVKYVITLDTDTQLARDTAWPFVGAMAHPLNRARYDRDRQRVTAGYGILQPRVAASLTGANRSRYARMCATEIGIDPYTRAVSDVYQDLFGEGSFIGKGIYEVNAFEQALGGRFPDNRILSHDLLEGCYARAGLLSDVQLYEEYPSRYSADASRRHRWIRGDWQIARWALPGVPGPDGRLQTNPLSLLSRWKIADNLRRSLTAAALTILLLSGWTLLPAAWFWTLAAVGILLVPSLIASALDALKKPIDVTLAQHLAGAVRSTGRHLVQVGFTLVCLPHEAFFSLDAVGRTAWRMLVSRKELLQWNPSGDSDSLDRGDLLGSCRAMWVGPVLAVAAGTALAVTRPGALGAAGPILALWFLSPAVAWWLSRPLARRREKLSEDQTLFLRRIARKTWAFFETFVGPEDHWLPPDNHQEQPVAVTAHRTSPTNMGLALLANLSAHDFGFIPAGQLLERTARTLDTMESLERHRGHFLNWYDTQTLKPLPPRYISAVDSGNLAGHLLTLRPGLLGLGSQKILGAHYVLGLRDAFLIASETGDAVPADTDPQALAPTGLAELGQEMDAAVLSPPATLEAWREFLTRLAALAQAADSGPKPPEAGSERSLGWWGEYASAVPGGPGRAGPARSMDRTSVFLRGPCGYFLSPRDPDPGGTGGTGGPARARDGPEAGPCRHGPGARQPWSGTGSGGCGQRAGQGAPRGPAGTGPAL